MLKISESIADGLSRSIHHSFVRITDNWETVSWETVVHRETVIWEKGKSGNRKFRKRKIRKHEILKMVNWKIVKLLIRHNTDASTRRPVLSIVHFVT